MKTKNQDGSADADGALSFDLVLALHPRVTTPDRAGAESSPSSDGDAGGDKTLRMASPGATVSLAHLSSPDKELLALVDGQRTVADVVRLSALSTEKAQTHLRALFDQGVLVAAPKIALDGSLGPPRPEDSDPGPSDGSSALTKAIDEYLELAASGLATAVADHSGALADTRLVSGAVAIPDGAANSLPGMVPDGVAPVTAGADQSAATKAAIEAMTARFPANVAGFRPNVTAFWIPAMGDGTPGAPPSPREESAAPASGGISDSGSGRSARSGAATVVVTGSPASGPNAIEARKVDGHAAVPPLAAPAADGVPSSGSAQPILSAPIPFRVGNYEVATRIAQGGMGSIYVCRRAGEAGVVQRLFTLKVVRQHSAKREEAVRSFKREAQVGSLLSHPNLQTVLDTGSYKDQPFLVLDYVEGTSLSELMADDRRPPVPVAVSMLLDVLRGLEHAHQLTDEKGTRLGLIHGDVSPQNVLVGVDGAARLTDFGSATFTAEGRAHDPKWVATGKPAYMSPEQLRAEPLDARTDVFAAGVLMWSVLTGQKLFAADSYDETIIKVLRKKIPPPSASGAPAYLDDVCLKALSRSREGRYGSAEEMARDLARVASRENALGTPADVAQWVRRESGETLGEQRRRIQFMFGTGNVSPARVDSPGSPSRGAVPGGAMPVGGRGRTAPPTILLDVPMPRGGQGPHTPQLGANKTLPARTVFLPGISRRPQKTFWKTWNVVIVSALLALPVTLTIGYFVSNLFAAHPAPPPPPLNAVDAATSQ